MKKQMKKLLVIGVIFIVSAGLAGSAFAWRGMGGGSNRGGGYSKNQDCPMSGQGMELSDKEIETLKKEREAFQKATEDLRRQIYIKNLELRAEMAKKTPNARTARGIQSQISKLQGDLAQKRVEHRIRLGKLVPGFKGRFGGGGMGGGGCMRGGGGMKGKGRMGGGMGHGRMMGGNQ